MAKDPALRPCSMCVRYDTCRVVRDRKVRYGAACFLTNEQALRAWIYGWNHLLRRNSHGTAELRNRW